MRQKQTDAFDLNLLDSEDARRITDELHRVGLLFPILQAGMERGYFAAVDSARPMLLNHTGHSVRLAIQFESRMAGCACNEDPTPEQALPEYMACELVFDETGWLESFSLLD